MRYATTSDVEPRLHFHCHDCGVRRLVDQPVTATEFDAQLTEFFASHERAALSAVSRPTQEGAP